MGMIDVVVEELDEAVDCALEVRGLDKDASLI